MEVEDVINLFDSCWFIQEIFKKSSDKPTSSRLKTIPAHQIQESSPKAEISSSKLTIYTRSESDHLMSSKASMNFGSFSPNSVLTAPHHLQSILSGIEGEAEFHQRTPQTREVKSGEKKKKKKTVKKGLSKSLSELEFQELKGFMDLGFVFSEEDKKDSTLVEIIPGLQRLGLLERNGEEEKGSSVHVHVHVHHESSITRPYLSEAWEDLDRRKKENPLMNWRVPSVNNEIGMKDSLKWWAQTVASTVK